MKHHIGQCKQLRQNVFYPPVRICLLGFNEKSTLLQPNALIEQTGLLCGMPPLLPQVLQSMIGIIYLLARSALPPLALATLLQPDTIDIQGKFFRWVYGKELNILDRAEIQIPSNRGLANVIQRNVNVVEAWRNRDNPIKPIRIVVIMMSIMNSDDQRSRCSQFGIYLKVETRKPSPIRIGLLNANTRIVFRVKHHVPHGIDP